MNMEIFKDIKGYPGYQISNLGRVWNENTQHYLKASLKPNGYYQGIIKSLYAGNEGR